MRLRERLFWLCVGAALIVLFISIIPSQYEICETTEKAQEKQCPTYRVLPFLVIKIGKILDDHNGAVTAIFTIVLAASTIALWAATRRLWVAGERQFKLTRAMSIRQSRDTKESIDIARKAYVAEHRTWLKIRPIEIGPITFKDARINLTIEIEVENIGNRPAIDVNIGCIPYRSGMRAIGRRGVEEAIAQQMRWRGITNEVVGPSVMPGDKASQRFLNFEFEVSETSAAENLEIGVPKANIPITLTVAFCAIYKSLSSDEWRSIGHSVWLSKADRSEFTPLRGNVDPINIRATMLPGDDVMS